MADEHTHADENTRTDADWERMARTEPYWAVQTDPDFRTANLTAERRAQFFEGGERFVNRVVTRCRPALGAPSVFDTSLDFGCGVGRLLIPLARRRRTAIGVDVSPTMLRVCADNCRSAASPTSSWCGGTTP
jgi:2-polyprenyl-3-methyl-5-hydroxy-6-metoxy-1,4-benzoquinol methylase